MARLHDHPVGARGRARVHGTQGVRRRGAEGKTLQLGVQPQVGGSLSRYREYLYVWVRVHQCASVRKGKKQKETDNQRKQTKSLAGSKTTVREWSGGPAKRSLVQYVCPFCFQSEENSKTADLVTSVSSLKNTDQFNKVLFTSFVKKVTSVFHCFLLKVLFCGDVKVFSVQTLGARVVLQEKPVLE